MKLYYPVFDEKIKVTGGNIGTAEYALPYRLMRDADIKKVNLVELGGIEPPTSCVPHKPSYHGTCPIPPL